MKVLLVANDGGHLQQLYQLRDRLRMSGQFMWLTNRSPQSESLLAGETVHYFPHINPRDSIGVTRNLWLARRVVADFGPDLAISTGSSLALSVLPQVMLRGAPAHYIESATRVSGPSMSGRLLSKLPRINLYTQYPDLAKGRWMYRGSVFDDYEAYEVAHAPASTKRVVVSLGTSKGYGFRRLLERVLPLVQGDYEVFWQTGSTDTKGLSIDGHIAVPSDQLRDQMVQADIVITHAGTGSAVASLEAGKKPILVPRDPARGEHVDGHQMHLATELQRRGLAWNVDADALTSASLEAAASWAVRKKVDKTPFELTPA